MSPRLKRALQFAGGGLAVGGIVFVLMRLRSYGAEINLETFSWATWIVVFVLATVYGASNLMLALAWRHLLRHFGSTVTARWAVWAYGVSQIAKYVPGNIFHLAGRQAMGASAGVPHRPLAQSTVGELAFIAAAGCMFSLLALPLLSSYVAVSTSATLFALALIVTAIVLRQVFSQAVVQALIWYTAFLLLSAALFVGLLEWLTKPDGIGVISWLPIIGAYVLAWLAGLVTPGAPAGIGVREAVLLLLLQGLVGGSDLILAVAFGRFVTAVGDVMFFVVSAVLRSE